ncbi:MAG TPA: M56 family metallopeptidase [Thermoanaerobaculia bacterium]|nr:M56 family metallopeptidase [Thermoanaerobaculia bacterium]
MIEHLIVSTVVLAVAMAAARFLPLTARTRYAVLLCGIAKFAVPTAVFRFLPVEVIPAALRTFGGGAAATIGAQPAPRIEWIPIAWAAIALLLLARWLLLRTRTVSAALRSPAPASPREVAAVREARVTMRVGVAVDAIRSPICEAPAVLRIVRPVIVLPAHGCDDLAEDELRSLVLHECAHVARHDNLGSVLQALATSLLWFHPLVWMASHALTIAREEACDEAVADAMHDSAAYVSALTKICRTITAPRTAGASCMASAKIKERMEHLMSYETIKGKAWSHRVILVVGVLMIALSTFATAAPESQDEKTYDGQPISMKLKAADIHDVLKTFGELTGLTFDVASDVKASVTMEVVDVPWDKVLDDLLNEHGLIGEIDGNTIHVRKR